MGFLALTGVDQGWDNFYFLVKGHWDNMSGATFRQQEEPELM